MIEAAKELQSLMALEHMVELERVSFSCFHEKMGNLFIFKREHIVRRMNSLAPNEELCAVVYIEGEESVHTFSLENGRRLRSSINDFNVSMRHMSEKMCDKKVTVSLVSKPRIYD